MSNLSRTHIMKPGQTLRVLLPGRKGVVEIDPNLFRDDRPVVRVDVISDSERYGPADDGLTYTVEDGEPGPGVVFLVGRSAAEGSAEQEEWDREVAYRQANGLIL